MDQLEHLTLVHDGAEGTVDKAHTAGDALVLIDLGAAVFVLGDGIHTAGLGTGALELDDSVIGAGRLALAALDTLALIDLGAAVLEIDGILGAGALAVTGDTALTGIGDLEMGVGAGMAGIFDNIDQRGIIILFRDGALLHTVGQHRMLVHMAQRKTHSQTDALTYDGALQKDGIALLTHLTG